MVNVFDYNSFVNEPWFSENRVAILVAAVIIIMWIVIWVVWKIIRYLDGTKIRDYHSNGPLDKMIDRRIEQLAARKR